MAKTTLDTLDQKLSDALDRIKSIDSTKVNKEVLELQLDEIKNDITFVKGEITRINGYGKWVIIVIGGAVLTALLNLVIGQK